MYRLLETSRTLFKNFKNYSIAIIVAVMLFVFGVNYYSNATSYIPSSIRDVVSTHLIQIEHLKLYDYEQRLFDLERLKGKWSFVIFGYTNCPDVCPATLSQLALLRSKLIRLTNISAPQFVFVSVDPDRDKPEQLDAFIKYFGEGFTAVSGSKDAISDFERQLGITHQYVYRDTAKNNYSVNHSSEIHLIDPLVRLYAKFRPPLEIDTLVGVYRSLLRFYLDDAAAFKI